MAKTIRDTILAYPGLADCEDFLDNVVLPGRGFEGTEDSKTIDIQKQKLVAADLYSMVGGLPDFTEQIYNYASGSNPYRYPNINFFSDDYIRKTSQDYNGVAEFSGGGRYAKADHRLSCLPGDKVAGCM